MHTRHAFFLVQWNTVKMPFPVSDIMANYMSGPSGDDDDDDEDDGFVIITGGCDSVKGNERLTIDIDNNETLDLFECMSVTNVTLKFDPVANTFTTMSPAPHARLRHAAAVVQGELYLLGGRDSLGNMVTAIDVRKNVVSVFFAGFCCLLLFRFSAACNIAACQCCLLQLLLLPYCSY
jgi:hypothetical protein